MPESTARIVWETVAIMPDCAFAGLGDPSLAGDTTWSRKGWPCIQVRRGGFGMLYGQAECDGLPVELGRISAEIVAARLEFTTDVAKLERRGEGHWTVLGRLRIGRKGGVAHDTRHPEIDRWCHHLPLAPGWYFAEVFETKDYYIGIRLVAERFVEVNPS